MTIGKWLALWALLAGVSLAQNVRSDGVVQSRNGQPSPGALVAVCTQPCTVPSNVSVSNPPSPLAGLCASSSDAACASPNPVTADSLGNYSFYVKPGKYTVVFYGSGLTARTQPDQILSCDPTNCVASSFNGRIFVDGVKYALSAVGIQAAINDAQSNGSREVWLPCGTINISTTLTITHGGFKLKGCGAGFTDAGATPATLLQWTGAAGQDLLQITGLSSARIDRVVLEDLILDGGNTARYGLRAEKVDEAELHGVRLRNGATASFYAVDSTGWHWYNVWLAQAPSYGAAFDWGTGGFKWIGGGIDTLVPGTTPVVLAQGALNGFHVFGIEADASSTGTFVGFFQFTGFDVNSSFPGAPVGGAGAPASVNLFGVQMFMKAGSQAPSQGAEILVTGTAANPTQHVNIFGLHSQGLSISQAAVKIDQAQNVTLFAGFSSGHTASTIITTANTGSPSYQYLKNSGDPFSCTGANCGVALGLKINSANGRLSSLAGFDCFTAAGCQLGNAAVPAADVFLGNAANQAVHFDVSALTAVRLKKFLDNSGTVAEHNIDNGFTATQTVPALALKNSNSLTITPNAIASARAVSVNDPLNSAVLSLYITAADNTVDLASVASGACTSERTVAVTGARFGDDVRVMAGTALEAGTFLAGKVTASDQIKWQFCNLSGGAVDRASDSYTIRVSK